MPKGKLYCERNGNYFKYYYKRNNQKKYITKEKVEKLQILAQKKYYEYRLNDVYKEINTIKYCIRQYEKHSAKAESILQESSGFRKLLVQSFLNFPADTKAWIEEEYIHNTFNAERRIHSTLSGESVRSKSEVLISNTLFLKQIPFRYECLLNLGEAQLFPDFTILHPKSRQIFYWEHFGMIDSESYREKAYNKLRLYGDYEIYPSVNLITTYETTSHPLDQQDIINIIEKYFL